MSESPRDIFLAALSRRRRRRTTRHATGSATSVVTTDLMGEVGVSFPEAHLDAEKMADLSWAGFELLGFDDVMPLFSVWHESSALGCDVDWGTRELMPDCRRPLFKLEDEIRIPPDFLSRPGTRVPLDALGVLRRRAGNEVAVVGKVMGPWTLSYHVFGVEEFLANTILAPGLVRHALDALKEVTVAFARAQIDAGADALCLADHATRDLCSPEAYASFLKPIHEELSERIRCPVILHICGETSDRLRFIRETGFECFHFDSKVAAARARELAGERLSLMGGTSNISVVRGGTPEMIATEAREKSAAGVDILGPECAVPLDAPWKNLRLLAEEAKEAGSFGGRRAGGRER